MRKFRKNLISIYSIFNKFFKFACTVKNNLHILVEVNPEYRLINKYIIENTYYENLENHSKINRLNELTSFFAKIIVSD